MAFQFGYLTPKQRRFWRLRFNGLTQAEISREMEITRQTVNKTLNVIDSKVNKALLEAAQINKVTINRMDSEKGFLLGQSPALGMPLLITFSDANGVQIWYKGEGHCSECEWLQSCKQKLITETKVRGIQVSNAEKMEPSKLADILFEKIMKE